MIETDSFHFKNLRFFLHLLLSSNHHAKEKAKETGILVETGVGQKSPVGQNAPQGREVLIDQLSFNLR
jgi:hypothetical protein